ncbi:hypothetical protein FIBSPDRAFT_860137 [Athelia psychrophila]|uniref:Uncharacterized protein n=1 Tax=Athelia psychrophila TaxID=1759441 RepID=A0A166KJI8_9AGAM|nr:hypothetical protein FIBSPDRAFT_875391 [Fibularhizoctonia sp. CBS 109695]KZP21970.1 hypothetical protein FIBSPDRAFT_860137 [Fibularhizoctonia sp. CBS 109695]
MSFRDSLLALGSWNGPFFVPLFQTFTLHYSLFAIHYSLFTVAPFLYVQFPM